MSLLGKYPDVSELTEVLFELNEGFSANLSAG
jgi:hypothetical protein